LRVHADGFRNLLLELVQNRQQLGTFNSKYYLICQIFGQPCGMPNLYFCQPGHRNTGMLRAVLTSEECSGIFAPDQGIFLGAHFPNSLCADGVQKDFSIVGITAAEATHEWRFGFYRFDADLMELNKRVLGLSK